MIYNSNPLFKGASGQFGGKFVFRQIRGKTFVSKMPRKPDRLKQTERQRGTRDKFIRASQFAKVITRNPELKDHYLSLAKKLNLTNAYTAALTEFMRNP